MTRKQETPEERAQRLAEHVAKTRAEQLAEAAAEMRAMDEILRILHPLPDDSRKRAMHWVAARLDNFTPPIASFLYDYNDEPPF